MKRILSKGTKKYLEKKIKVAGWVNSRRSHGKIIFIDLRDKSGLLQLVFSPDNKESYKIAQELKPEWVIEAIGQVSQRPKGMKNPKIDSGEIELKVESLEVHSQAKTLPFAINTPGYEISEEKRLKYRYLDLRRERMKRNLETRQKVIQFMREFLIKEGFVEIETPLLTKSTPEGARDFLVPSRMQPGKFYALPQSPQQYKQLLQVAGFEKYFQIARCLRDEDPRADRQAECAQLDIEMSFLEQEEIFNLVEKLFVDLIKNLFPPKKINKVPFPRLTYQEAMKKYKSDKPDLRKDKNNPDELAFAWIYDFPMFERRPSTGSGQGKWGAMHHPFTKPKTENIKEIKKQPEKVLAWQYDLVINGVEIGGGSLRTTNPDVLTAVFEVLGHKKEEIKNQFGHLLEAFEYGVPPHGGIAQGIDRFLATVLGEPNIREVISFPKTGDGRGLTMNTPSTVSTEQLKELHLKIISKKKK